jgi:glyoxylase-like metal-dependent hydrolase (beta-lactamase superfamily II)
VAWRKQDSKENSQLSWHTTTRIASNVYHISEPVGEIEPRFNAPTVNVYLVVGGEHAALIDSGLGVGDLGTEIGALTSLPCIVLNTHAHWDHIGGNAHFDEIAIHELEAGAMTVEPNMGAIRKVMKSPRARAALPPSFDPDTYRIRTKPATRILHDGDLIDLGDHTLEVLHIPGHSPGHVAYLDAANGMLFTGDTACLSPIYACFPGCDPAGLANSAKRMAALPGVRTVCPGHGEIITEEGWLGKFAACAEAAVSGQAEGKARDGFVKGREFRFDTLSIWLPA